MNSYPKEYMEYLVYFHADRDYFECHEVLEEYWKLDPKSKWNKAWVGLIQVAVAMYHHRRNNINGAKKMLSSAIVNLSEQDLYSLGIDALVFHQILNDRLKQLTEKPQESFEDVNIPLKDKQLLNLCMDQCTEQQIDWAKPSDLLNEALIHKHSLRDRTEVIQKRLSEKERKQLLRNKGDLN
jgi:predicted metal-dependent hydrolase